MDYVKLVCITGDVSALASDEKLLKTWAFETAKEVWEQKSYLAVIHIQGLKAAFDPDAFAETLLRSLIFEPPQIMEHFDTSRAFFDSQETGLGSIYLFKNSQGVEYFDKYKMQYKSTKSGHQSEIGAREAEGFYGQSFHTHSFLGHRSKYHNLCNDKNSQPHNTGYLMARYRILGKEFSFINLNLHSVPFIDVSELVEQPDITKAAKLRRQQIGMLLENLKTEGLKGDSIIMAGAFNAQIQETDLLGDLAKTQHATNYAMTDHEGHVEGIEQRDRHGRKLVTVESQRFDLHTIHDWFFRLGRGQMAKKYNGELAQVVFEGKLHEESVFHRPSRHYEQVVNEDKDQFTRELCPCWADRVLYNERMSRLFRHDSFCASGLYYGLVAEHVHVGASKPVTLHATICLK